MEVLSPFCHWTLGMLKRNKVTVHHIITVYYDMFNHIDGVMRALPRKRTQWKETIYFAMRFAGQKLSKYYSEVTPTTCQLPITAHILDSLWKLRSFRK
jgi:hypothetical protein